MKVIGKTSPIYNIEGHIVNTNYLDESIVLLSSREIEVLKMLTEAKFAVNNFKSMVEELESILEGKKDDL